MTCQTHRPHSMTCEHLVISGGLGRLLAERGNLPTAKSCQRLFSLSNPSLEHQSLACASQPFRVLLCLARLPLLGGLLRRSAGGGATSGGGSPGSGGVGAWLARMCAIAEPKGFKGAAPVLQ